MQITEVLKRQFLLMHVSRIPVRIDYRWFFVFVLMSAVTASGIYPLVQDVLASIVMGVVATLLLFASIFFHELAHSIVARMEDLQVVEIVLHPFGGLTRFRHEPQTPRAEFRIAIAGPAASFLLTIFFLVLMAGANYAGTDILAILLFVLALWNFLLAVFNLFPGYPLDGGRVLRAYLWKNGKDLNEATILTGRCGQIIAVGLIALGLLVVVFRGEFFTGFWAILVGIFLFDSASGIIREVNAAGALLAGDVMSLPAAISPDSSIQNFVDTVLPMHRRSVFLVAGDRQLLGMLLLEDMKKIERDFWRVTFIRDVMRPVASELFVETATPFTDAKELMRTNGVGALGVIDAAGKLVGFLSRGSVKKVR